MPMPMNMMENGPSVPLGEPPDSQPMTLADACDVWLGHVRRALRDGTSREEMTLIGATFKAVEMEIQNSMAAQGAAPGGESAPPEAGPGDETQDVGAGAGEPMEDQYRR